MRLNVVALILSVCFAGPASAQAPAPPRKADLTPIVETDAVHAGTTVRAALNVSLPDKFHVNSNTPRDKYLIPVTLVVNPPAGVTVGSLVFPTPTDLMQQGETAPLSVFEREFAIGVPLQIAASVPPGELRVPGQLRYQACDETRCYLPVRMPVEWVLRVVPARTPLAAVNAGAIKKIAFNDAAAPAAAAPASPPPAATPLPGPEPIATTITNPLVLLDDFTIAGSEGGYLNTAAFLKFLENAESGAAPKGLFEGRGPIAILLIVFLGGLALNLTPCVLPMIPINLAIIGAGAQAGSRARGLLLGSAYGAAMAVVYGVLGLVVILSAGTFGTINASPWFNVAIAVLFVFLALAMFDIFEIDFSRFMGRVDDTKRGTMALAFTMGAVAALLAGACVAPVVIQVVLFSSNLYATGTTAALALPFVLGLGMAVPWPLAGAGIAALPKPGAWMVRVKQAFGVVILATAAYYGYTAYTLFANRAVDPAQVASSVQAQLKDGWHASLAEGLAVARRENKPVLLDMWATWCKNCLTMDKTTLADPEVKRALSGYVKIKFQAEDPEASPAREVMQRFNAIGLPTYIVLKPKDSREQTEPLDR